MNKNNEVRSAYLPPEIQERLYVPVVVIATSDWNNAQIDDDFVDVYDL